MHYTTRHLSSLFGVSHQTVKNWAKEFQRYLSPTATPGNRRQRKYTDDDLAVFALVHKMKEQGRVYEEIHLALGAGQRGEIPLESGALVPVRVSTQIVALEERISQLVTQLQGAQNDAQQQRGQVGLLKEILSHKESEIRELYKQVARLEAHLKDDD